MEEFSVSKILLCITTMLRPGPSSPLDSNWTRKMEVCAIPSFWCISCIFAALVPMRGPRPESLGIIQGSWAILAYFSFLSKLNLVNCALWISEMYFAISLEYSYNVCRYNNWLLLVQTVTRSSMSGGPVSVSPPRVVRHLGPQLLGVTRGVDACCRCRREEVGGVLGVGRPRPLAQPRHGERTGRGRGPPGRGVGGVWAVGNSGHLQVKSSVLCSFFIAFPITWRIFRDKGLLHRVVVQAVVVDWGLSHQDASLIPPEFGATVLKPDLIY